MKIEKKQDKKNRKSIGQFLYLTSKFFVKNNLTTYASACSLGFLFSFIPIILIIALFLVNFFHTSPDIFFQFFDLSAIFVDPDKIEGIASQLTETEKISILTIVLIVSIFWMGQRFFFSIEKGIKTIFHLGTAIKRRPAIEKVLLIFGEIILVVATALLLFMFITAKAIFSRQVILNKFILPYFPNFLISTIKNRFFNLIPYLYITILSATMYKLASGSKPAWKICFLTSIINSAIFLFITFLLGKFMNIARYNLVYGVLSNLIIVLFEVYIYFTLFFFSAQGIFVYQFFDSLLLSEVYLWQPDSGFYLKEIVKHYLFADPRQLISQENQRLTFESSSIVYKENSDPEGIYYIVEGSIKLYRENYIGYAQTGDFFGDYDCILEQKHTLTVETIGKTTLIFIKKNQFAQLIESNPEISQKVLGNLSQHIYNVYGRK
ncbi:MAG: YhjD/YihY/BrkB family envelope integrity protein [Treponemataceae bacterium]